MIETSKNSVDYSHSSAKEIKKIKKKQTSEKVDNLIRNAKIDSKKFDARKYLRAYLQGQEQAMLADL